MNIAIEYNCCEWDYDAVRTAMRLSANNVPDQIDTIVLVCDQNKVVLPSNGTMVKHLKKTSGTLEKIFVLKPDELNEIPKEMVLGCCVDINPQPNITNKAKTIKARRYLTLVHTEKLEEFDWSN